MTNPVAEHPVDSERLRAAVPHGNMPTLWRSPTSSPATRPGSRRV